MYYIVQSQNKAKTVNGQNLHFDISVQLIENINDLPTIDDKCSQSYILKQINNHNPTLTDELYDINAVDMTPNESLDTLQVSIIAAEDNDVIAYNADESVKCNLGNPLTKKCKIEYSISGQTLNDTFDSIASLDITYWSECYNLEYDQTYIGSERAQIWQWDDYAKQTFAANYQVRDPE